MVFLSIIGRTASCNHYQQSGKAVSGLRIHRFAIYRSETEIVFWK